MKTHRTVIGVLKGAIMAMADLSRYLQRHVDMDWMSYSAVSSWVWRLM